jgi:hypothetical protein
MLLRPSISGKSVDYTDDEFQTVCTYKTGLEGAFNCNF